MAQILRLGVTVHEPPGLYERAFLFARTHSLNATYDSLYVMLVQMADTELWTADRRLFNAVRAATPWVRWIGDYRG